ncbi:MAG: twin transmembrane helix small protein [Pseudomonadota bacterium]|nr:twin transmembrane helix small protein [Pseudomonadota bacterium]
MTIFNYLISAGLVAVSLVLLAGLANMLKNGSPNTSQRLMRWRVGLQLFTIIVVMFGVYLSN